MSNHVEEIQVGMHQETRTVPTILRIEIERDRQRDPSRDESPEIHCYKAEARLGHKQLFVLSIWSDNTQSVRSAVDVLLRHLLAPNHGFEPIR